MASTKTTRTLFFYLTLLVAFASLADASSQPQMNHKRLVKKRSLQILPPSEPAGTDSPSPHPGSGSSTSVDSTPSDSVVTPLIGRPSPVSTSTSSSSSSSTTSTSSSPTSTSTSSTSTSSSSSSSSSTSTSSSSSTSSTSTSTSSTSDGFSTFTSTAIFTGTSASSSPMPHADDSSGSGSKKTTTTIIIVIAASVGGIAILWTLFRKWKLARSSRFDNRLQPIDWQPPAAGETRRRPTSVGSPILPTAHGAHGSEHGHGSSDLGHGGRLTPLSDHDFTPLPSNHLAAVGTYADLARGPSPQPPMYEAYSGQAPVVTRPTYDVNVPLHHQAGYGGHDAYEYTHYNSAPRGY